MAILAGTSADDSLSTTNSNYQFGMLDDRVCGFDGSDNIFTGAGEDYLNGGNHDDTLGSGDGNDTVVAGAGNDTILVDAGDDVYHGGSGNDTLIVQYIHMGPDAEGFVGDIKIDLASTKAQNLGEFGTDSFFGFESIDGSFGNDTFLGTSGVNWLGGREGNDVLNGRGGNDTIVGGDGADTLIGGLGKDKIDLKSISEAGSFRDIVRYESLKDSGTTAATRDDIYWFKHGQDKIDLSKLDANLSLKGNQAFKVVTGFTTASGEIKLVKSGADTIVQIDGDRDSAIDMTFVVLGAHLTKGDVIL